MRETGAEGMGYENITYFAYTKLHDIWMAPSYSNKMHKIINSNFRKKTMQCMHHDTPSPPPNVFSDISIKMIYFLAYL